MVMAVDNRQVFVGRTPSSAEVELHKLSVAVAELHKLAVVDRMQEVDNHHHTVAAGTTVAAVEDRIAVVAEGMVENMLQVDQQVQGYIEEVVVVGIHSVD